MLPAGIKVVVVPDEDVHAVEIPPGLLQMLSQENIIMSNDSLRMYVRHTHWENMKESFLLTNKIAGVIEQYR